jgi:hypothetical protein
MAHQPAGWYRDPNDPSMERYWYGDVWSPDKTRPVGSWRPEPQRPLIRSTRRNRLGVIIPLTFALMALVAAVVLFVTHPSATYSAVRPIPDPIPGYQSLPPAATTQSESVGCSSGWEHFTNTGSHPTVSGALASLGSYQNLQSAGDACNKSIAGRDHLTIALLVIAALLATTALVIGVATRRPPQARSA